MASHKKKKHAATFRNGTENIFNFISCVFILINYGYFSNPCVMDAFSFLISSFYLVNSIVGFDFFMLFSKFYITSLSFKIIK